jgi:hypothetical protein
MTALGALGAGLTYGLAGAERFWINWLLWFLFFLTLSLGALFLVALEHLVGARWSVPLRRIPERISSLLLVVAPMALVALGAVPVLYPGARPEALQNQVLAGKAHRLGLPFFSVRTVMCVVLCLISLVVLVKGSLAQDQTGDAAFTKRARRFAPAFMAIFALVITMAAFDWVSGLSPEWYSDIIGVYFFAGSFLAGLAATVLGVAYLQRQARLKDVRSDHLYNLGGFLFAFTVFWSYIGCAQYMLMWYADLPEEVICYKVRLAGAWHGVTLALVLLPFLALITRDAKRSGRRLLWVALVMLGAHLLDLYWLLFPALGGQPRFSWPELSFAMLFLGAGLLWLRAAMEQGEDMPVGDPSLRDGLEFRL